MIKVIKDLLLSYRFNLRCVRGTAGVQSVRIIGFKGISAIGQEFRVMLG
jgi:hypothetical protein